MKFSTVLAGAAALTGSLVAAELDPIIVKGSKFFHESDGSEFFMRGIAYQQRPKDGEYRDPLADPEACKRDVPLLKELKTNTIRVYAIHPDEDHTECMKLLDDAGIYVVSDLSEPQLSINRADPKWDDDLYGRYTAVIDELSQFSNVLGFFAGNEVTNNATNTPASAFVKAAVRDMKAYIKFKEYRPMGVGYATSDDSHIRENVANYFACNDESEIVDFWGYNIYSWCGDSTFKESGYDRVVEDFKDYPGAVFFAEYGCNDVKPRTFTQVPVMYGDKMTPVLSGGIVYMYYEEANEYGLVKVNDDKVEKKDDFNNLRDQLNEVDPQGVKESDYKPAGELRKCPEVGDEWEASSKLPPTPNRQLCECMAKSLSCVVSKDVTDKQLGDLFGTVCGMDKEACAGTAADATKGVYGAYSMCNPREQLSHAFNAYYENSGQDSQACDFDGAATTQEAEDPSGECSNLMGQAGPEGTGTVTSRPTADSNSGEKDSSATTSSSAANARNIPAFNFGLLKLAAYVLCAMLGGAGVILL